MFWEELEEEDAKEQLRHVIVTMNLVDSSIPRVHVLLKLHKYVSHYG